MVIDQLPTTSRLRVTHTNITINTTSVPCDTVTSSDYMSSNRDLPTKNECAATEISTYRTRLRKQPSSSVSRLNGALLRPTGYSRNPVPAFSLSFSETPLANTVLSICKNNSLKPSYNTIVSAEVAETVLMADHVSCSNIDSTTAGVVL